MGCNCSKGRAVAAAARKARQEGRNQGSTKSLPQPPPSAPPPVRRSAGEVQTFTLETGGRSESFGSRLEAEAAQVRRGGVVHIA